MPYLSRIPLAPLRTGTRKLLNSPQAMHAAILGSVAYHPDPGRTLWRLDADNPHRPHLYTVTQVEPDFTALVEQAGWAVDNPHAKPTVADYKPLLANLEAGQTYAFRLTASPVQNTRTPQKPTPAQAARTAASTKERAPSHRLGHRTTHHQLAWFTNRVHKHGFELLTLPNTQDPAPGILPLPNTDTSETEQLLDVRVTARDRLVFNKTLTGPGGAKTGTTKVTITTASYAGTLRVADPVELARTLITGIGSAKAYGCGLLTLAHPHQ
ncbi:type I-E CRISPR-associated protein Cas6/Cse3/CasE [Streptomyces luteogriseus]|uniref:type I-E CRISPR-associated protein Cas6/Cse3/CasE n=1 Tax=Streptomyces luteogriseus TaxID=68233 RepID=UPI00379003B1